MLQGSYNMELPRSSGFVAMTAPSVCRLTFTQSGRALLTARLGDNSQLVASPVWNANNGLYFHNLTNGNRSMTRGDMTYLKGVSPDDWDTVITASITKPRHVARSPKSYLPSNLSFQWAGSGTRYLPPDVPFLSGPMPFNSRQIDPAYALLMDTTSQPWVHGTIGTLYPNFTGSGYSPSQVRALDYPGYFTLPSTLKVSPRTGLISGRFWAASVVEQNNDEGYFIRYKKSISRPSYSGLVVRERNSTISTGSCQSTMPYFHYGYYYDSEGYYQETLTRTSGSQGIFLFVQGQ
jgi:hypothetical protein